MPTGQTIDLKDFCNTTQQAMNEVVGKLNPQTHQEPKGFLESLISDENRSLAQIEIDKQNGKTITASVRYFQPAALDDSSDAEASICDDGVQRDPLIDKVSLTSYVRSEIMAFPDSQLRTLCEDQPDVFAKMLLGQLNSAERRLDRRLLALYATKYGEFYNVAGPPAPKDITLLKEEDGELKAIYSGEITLQNDLRSLGVMARPFVVGAGNVDAYAELKNIGCCNNYGQDVSRFGNWMYYFDNNVEEVLGPSDANESKMVVYVPGAVQFLKANENVGTFAKNWDHLKLGTIKSPYTGIVWDLHMKYDDCDSVWKQFFKLRFGMWTIPTDAFEANDSRRGVNFSFLYNAVKTVVV